MQAHLFQTRIYSGGSASTPSAVPWLDECVLIAWGDQVCVGVWAHLNVFIAWGGQGVCKLTWRPVLCPEVACSRCSNVHVMKRSSLPVSGSVHGGTRGLSYWCPVCLFSWRPPGAKQRPFKNTLGHVNWKPSTFIIDISLYERLSNKSMFTYRIYGTNIKKVIIWDRFAI